MSNLTIRCPCGFTVRGTELQPNIVQAIGQAFITYHRCPKGYE